MSEQQQELSGKAIWTWPIVLGVLTLVGLIAALFSDGGLGDMLAGLCLWVPALVGLWYGWLRRYRAN
ncbi:hypothetical protein DW355_00495 [Hylemonella gracilis]|uniref:DUF4175 domain-containing protein n=1 Tax=Hylemonella gracilis TaxID=80880 RepID=A0A4P6UJF6_9BURK|nr:hypothetical protein [Hylemonella gracilis]QBK03451.1 hypothetical protein DW355_00495 [Hylemonella gracilis]